MYPKFRVLVAVMCCILILSLPLQSSALDFSFDILSVGPFSLEKTIKGSTASEIFGGLALAGMVISFFSKPDRGNKSRESSRRYYTSYSNDYNYHTSECYTPPKPKPLPKRITVEIDPNDHMEKRPFRMKYHDILDANDQIALTHGGYLQLQDDGKMVFNETNFEGYMYLHYNKTLSVWDNEDNPILVLSIDDENYLWVIQHDSETAAQVFEILLGCAPIAEN